MPAATDDPLFYRPDYDKMYLLGNPPDYEQPTENTLGAQAATASDGSRKRWPMMRC